jgi:hypothetical protein
VRTAVTNTREHVSDLVDWLTTIFDRDGWLPESLHLVGARDDLDAVAGPIGEALPIPVSDSLDTQLALARGAALVMVTPIAVRTAPTVEAPTDDHDEPAPRRDRPWLAAHAKRVTISAAAVAIVGAALSLAAGSALNVETVSAQVANPPAEGASVTSASVPTAPTRISTPPAAPVQPLAAQPQPAAPAPPATPRLPAEPLAAALPEAVSAPVHETVSAPPPAASLAAPAVTPPAAAPIAPPAAAPIAPPAAAPIAPPAAAPIAPPPAAPLAVPPPAAPPPPPEPAEPPPPPDPLQVVLSPLFGGLP